MNKNENLLIKDLVCRLPYGVKCLVEIDDTEYDEFTGKDIGFKGKSIGELYVLDMNDNHVELYFNEKNNVSDELSDMSMEGLITINDIKPYLRPMSSMTEDEKKEFSVFIGRTERYVQEICLDADSMINPIIGGFQCVYWGLFDKCIDWLNNHYFDYRGLIEKGLALEATREIYNY